MSTGQPLAVDGPAGRRDGGDAIVASEVYGPGTTDQLIRRLSAELENAKGIIAAASHAHCTGCRRLSEVYLRLVNHLVALSERNRYVESQAQSDRGLLAGAVRRAFPEPARRLAEQSQGGARVETMPMPTLCQWITRWAAEQKEEALTSGKRLAGRQLRETTDQLDQALTALDAARSAVKSHDHVRHMMGGAMIGVADAALDRLLNGEASLFDTVLDAAREAGGRAVWEVDGVAVTIDIKDRSGGRQADGGSPPPRRSSAERRRSPEPTGEAPPPGGAARRREEAQHPSRKEPPGAVAAPGAGRRGSAPGSRSEMQDLAVRLVVEHVAWTRHLLATLGAAQGVELPTLEAALVRGRIVEPVSVGDDALYFSTGALDDAANRAVPNQQERAGYFLWHVVGPLAKSAEERRALADALTPFLSGGWRMTYTTRNDDAFWFVLEHDPAEGRYRIGVLAVCVGGMPAKIPKDLVASASDVFWLAAETDRVVEPHGVPPAADLWFASLPVAATESAWTPVRRHDRDRPLR